MELTVLGNYGPFPPKSGACSSYLLTLESGSSVILDMGPGSLSRLQEYIALPDIKAIFLSHLHYDHISDIFALKYALAFLKNRDIIKKKIPLILPETPMDVAVSVADETLFDIAYIKPDRKIALYGAVFSFPVMKHPVEAYAVCVEEGAKRFVYTGDTCYHETLSDVAKGADLFLVDAGLLERDLTPMSAHLSVAQACVVGEGAKRTVLTHLMPLYARAALEAEAQGRAEFSKNGARYNI